MKSDFLPMSVLWAWRKGADQEMCSGDGCVAPEHWRSRRAMYRWQGAKCTGGRVHLTFAPIWNRQVKSIDEALEKKNLANAASRNYRLKWSENYYKWNIQRQLDY